MNPNVMILLGAGRGGTTLLYKLLALHAHFGYLSNYQQRVPGVLALSALQRPIRHLHSLKLATWFASDGGAYFGERRARLHALIPAPVECEVVYARAGVPLDTNEVHERDSVARERLVQAFADLQWWTGARVILAKRTPNNRRVAWLHRALPQARYVHLVRDGRAVARSLLQVGWWLDHTLFWAGRTPRQLVAEGRDEVELAGRNWVEEMGQISDGLASVPAHQVVTVRYESLLREPLATLSGILAFAGVDPADDAGFAAAVGRVGLRSGTPAWDRGLTPEARRVLLAVQGPELMRWGYLQAAAASHP